MKREISFILGEKRGRGGSALLRGEQLSSIVEPVLTEAGYKVSVRIGVGEIENAAVIVNKTALLDHGIDGLKGLKARGNRIIVDPIDLPMSMPIWDIPDVVLSSSLRQDRDIRGRIPDRPCIYVPHHADLRIEAFPYQSSTDSEPEKSRCAYIGDPLQCRHLEELESGGVLTVINATNRRGEWMKELPKFAFHYAVRPPQQHKGLFKPFTKGAVAAACGAFILCDRYDEEAILSLGPDYPFLIDDATDPQNVIAALSKFTAESRPEVLGCARSSLERLKKMNSPDTIRSIFKDRIVDSNLLE